MKRLSGVWSAGMGLVGAVLVFVGCAQAQQDAPYSYERVYEVGGEDEYVMVTVTTHNDGPPQSEMSWSTHTNVFDPVPGEEMRWTRLETRPWEEDLIDGSEFARAQPPHRLSLYGDGDISLPPISDAAVTGAITDLITFWAGLSLMLDQDALHAEGDVFHRPEAVTGDWADGRSVIYGEDCTIVTMTLVELERRQVRLKLEFLAPETACLEFPNAVFNTPVREGQLNNFSQIRQDDTGFAPMWGLETYTVEVPVDRASGRLKHGRLTNTLDLQMAGGCDEALEACQYQMSFLIERTVSILRRR